MATAPKTLIHVVTVSWKADATEDQIQAALDTLMHGRTSFVIAQRISTVINADKIQVSGKKRDQKLYIHHTGYPGGVYETSFRKMQERFPGRALQIAVKGMLPKGPLGYAMIKKLKVYADGQHPHTAQQPKSIEI